MTPETKQDAPVGRTQELAEKAVRGELEILEAHLTPHEHRVVLGGQAVAQLGLLMATWFMEAGGPNYYEVHIDATGPTIRDTEAGELLFTVQRRNGKTPHQLRKAAEEVVDRARGAFEYLADLLGRDDYCRLPGSQTSWEIVVNMREQCEALIEGREPVQPQRHPEHRAAISKHLRRRQINSKL